MATQFDGVVRYASWLALLGDWAYDADAAPQSRTSTGAPALRLSLLVALGLSQAQGQERGPVHRQLRRSGRRRGAPRAASTASSAATSIMPRSATSTACSIATTATGSRAAPRWSSISTARSRSSTGSSAARSIRSTRAPDAPSCDWRAEYREDRCSSPTPGAPQVNGVVRTLTEIDRASSARAATRSTAITPRPASAPCPARPIPRSAWRCVAGRRDRRA